MKKKIFSIFMLLLVVSMGAWATEKELSPVGVLSWTNTPAITYDGEATSWAINQGGISGGKLGKYAGPYAIVKFDASSILDGMTLLSATLDFDITAGGYNSSINIAQMSDATFTPSTVTVDDFDATATQFQSGDWSTKNATIHFSYDVKARVEANNVLAFAIYTNTGREQTLKDVKLVLNYSDAPVAKYNYSLKAVTSEALDIKTLAEGEEFETNDVTLYFPYMFYNESTLYTTSTKPYSVTVDKDNANKTVTYAADGGDIVAYMEGEAAEANSGFDAAYSNGKTGHAAGNKTVTIATLPAGKYTATINFVANGNRSCVIRNTANTDVATNAIVSLPIDKNSSAGIYTSDEFTLTEETTIGFSGYTSDTKTNQSADIDYIFIEKTGEYVPVVTSYAVTISDEIENGTVVADPTSANAGAEVTLTNTPAEGYEFVSYSVTGVKSNEAVPVTDGKFTMPADDVTVSATFAKVYAVTISNEIENGTVVADPTSAKAGDEVTLTNTPAEGYEFVSYSVTGVKSNEAVPVTDGKFTMPADDVTVSATFAKVYAVTISDEIENGKVVADPTSAKAGDEVTLTNTPAEGYEFVSYSVTGVHEELAVEVTDGKFTMPADDVTVSATFQLPVPATYAVNIAEGIEGGTVSADPTSAKEGDEVTLTNTPAEGYEFVSYSVTGVHEELAVIVTDGKFTMPADDVTVSAEFKAVDPSGDEEVALAADMFYTWDGYGADASKIASATVDFKVGESVGAGTTVVGTGSVDYLTYADMTGSTKVIFEGTDGTVIRLLMNRQESNNGPLVEKNATIAEGKAEISLTDLTYVHVNAIKIPYNGSTGNIISSITFIKPNDPLAGPKEALKDAIAAAKMQNSVAKTEESFAALTKAISDGEAALADAQATVESLTTAKSDIETAVKGLTLAEGYAEVTKEMFKQYASVDEPGEGTTTGGAYELFTASDLPYGDSSVSELKWADLTKYDKLIVAVAGTTAPRFCMNRLVKEGQQAATQEDSKMIDINPNNDNTWSTEKYQTVENGVYTIDLATIVSDYGFARLHCIKKQGWGAGVVVTGMYLHEAPAYTVNIAAEIENGTVVADPTSAVAGEKVTLTATPAEGYTLASVSVTGVHEDLAVEVTDGKFTMPADDVTVNATFEKTPYSIEYALGMQNGTVTGPVSATADEKVTLTVTPAEGYELETLKVTCAVSGNEINYDVTDYSFTMPAEGVYVIATFQKKPVYIETDLTKDFEALTDVSKWTGASGYTDTQYCPAVTTNSGKTVQVCERYDPTCANTGDVFYQTVTGLTPGTYKIELYGGAAFTFGRGFGSMAFTGEIGTGDPWGTHVSETYQAGDKIEPSVENPTGVSLTATTSEGTYGGEIPIYYATNFPAGAAVVTLSGVKIGANGEIKIGMSKTSQSTNWHVIQLKGVTAQVRADVLLAKAVADAQGVAESDVPAKLYSEIQTAIETYDKEYSTADEYQTAINALNALVDKANGYVTLTAVLNEGDQYKANVPAEDPAIAAYDAAIADVKGAYDDAVVADIPAAVKVVEAALPALAKAQTAPGSDLTTLVNNTSWTCPQGNGPGKYQEIYTETYNESAYQPGKVIYQKIEGLIPGGVYEVKFLAVANTAWGKSNFGDGLAQVYANEVTSDISVIEQNNCNPTEYEQTLTAEVGDDGVFEYGMQNVAAGGNWYVVKGVSMTLKEVIISYSVDIAEGIENGTVEVSAKKAAAGEEVTITATPAEGYELVSVSVKGVKSDIAVQVVTDEVTGEMSFTMPNDAVVVSATFKEIAYPITYAIGMQNGTVEGPVESVAGEKVTLTVTPAEGYELENLTITCAESQNEINYDVVDYSFTMPKEGVYIIATFVQTTGIDAASAAKGKKIGVKKYFKNGELIIIGKDGKEFRANGAAK